MVGLVKVYCYFSRLRYVMVRASALSLQGVHNILSPIVKIVTLPFIILSDNTEGFYKLYHIHLQYFLLYYTFFSIWQKPEVSSRSGCAPSLSLQIIILRRMFFGTFSGAFLG